jgi:hypothetical protein
MDRAIIPFFVAAVAFFVTALVPARSQTLLWSKEFAGIDTSQNTRGDYVVRTHDGKYFLAGMNGSNLYLVCTGSDGTVLWEKMADTGRAIPQHIDEDNGELLVLYHAERDGRRLPFVAKFDASGEELWKFVLNPGTYLSDIVPVAPGEYMVVGIIDTDGYIARYDSTGRQKWEHRTTSFIEPRGVSVDGENVIVSGRIFSVSTKSDCYVMRLSQAGDSLSAWTFGTTQSDAAIATYPLGDGTYEVVGTTNWTPSGEAASLRHLYFAALDGRGMVQRTWYIDTIEVNEIVSIRRLSNGGYLTANRANINRLLWLNPDKSVKWKPSGKIDARTPTYYDVQSIDDH